MGHPALECFGLGLTTAKNEGMEAVFFVQTEIPQSGLRTGTWTAFRGR